MDLEKPEDRANRNSTEFNKKRTIMHVGHHHAWHQSRLGTDGLPGQTSLQHTLILNNANLILDCTMMNKASRLQEVTIPSARCWGGHTSVPHPVVGPQIQEGHGKSRDEPAEVIKVIGVFGLWAMRKGWGRPASLV